MMVEQTGFTVTEPVLIQLDMRALKDNTELGTASVTVNLTHETDITMSVDSLQTASSAEYFTLEGIRVAEPLKGHLYIERKGGKAVKRVF